MRNYFPFSIVGTIIITLGIKFFYIRDILNITIINYSSLKHLQKSFISNDIFTSKTCFIVPTFQESDYTFVLGVVFLTLN